MAQQPAPLIAVGEPAPSTPATWVTDAKTCFAALALTLGVVGAGHAAGMTVSSALGHWLPNLSPSVLHLATPLISCVYQVVFGWLAIRIFLRTGELRWRDLSLCMPRLKLWHWIAIVLGLYAAKAAASIVAVSFAMPAGAGAAAGTGTSVAPTGLAPLAALMKSEAWLLMLAGGVIAAMLEEIIYRGYLSRTLEATRLGWFAGAFVASLVWAGLHIYYPLPLQAVLVIVGLALSYTRRQTGSIYPGMLWHVINNIVGLIALRLLA